MEEDIRPVVVGVTGPGENDAALRLAAEEAHRRGVDVCIVHAVQEAGLPPAADPVLSNDVAWKDVGNRIVAEVLEEFRSLYGDVNATAMTRHGNPVDALTDFSSSARVVVLQHRDLSALRRIFTGSTVTGVAARAECPVTSVPAAWNPGDGPGRVTVGLDEGELPTAVLAEAFAEADARNWSLRVARAWKTDSMYEELIVTNEEQWREKVEASVRSALEQMSPRSSDVPVEVEVRHQWPADVLVELSATSNLLVVGRHNHHESRSKRVGSIARALLRSAKCPVMVVPV